MKKPNLALVFVAACISCLLLMPAIYTSSTAYKEDRTVVLPQLSTLVVEQSNPATGICLELAEQYFDELEALFEKDGGALWGVNLGAPFVFVELATRVVVSNSPDPQGVLSRQGNLYVGLLPDNIFMGNTVVDFGGKRFAMATWCTMESNVAFKTGRLRVMSHEAFHWWQPELFGRIERWDNSHVNEFDALKSILLEANALTLALKSSEEDRFDAVVDALSIRSARRTQFPKTAVNENRLEIIEGLAVYTELMLNFDTDWEIELAIDSWGHFLRASSSPEKHFGYLTGALYALLLDEFCTNWKTLVGPSTDLSALLHNAIGNPRLRSLCRIDLNLYGFDAVSLIAGKRAGAHLKTIGTIQEAFSGPILTVTSGFGKAVMNVCNNMVQTPDMGEVFLGFVELSGNFGRLSMRDGGHVLLTNENHIVVPAEGIRIIGNRAIGQGWTMVLNEGFHFVGEGTDFSVRRIM